MIKNKKQAAAIAIILFFTLIIVLAGCGEKTSNKAAQGTVSVSFVFDVYDMDARMGDADYVFVGSVLEETGTRHILEEGFPKTSYKIQVLKNIKGNLSTDLAIPLEKDGGYSDIEDFTYLYEDDYLPSQGDTCIFFAYANAEEDALGVSGPNSTLLLKDETSKASVDRSVLQAKGEKAKDACLREYREYRKVTDAFDSQFEPREREHYHSKYEQQIK